GANSICLWNFSSMNGWLSPRRTAAGPRRLNTSRKEGVEDGQNDWGAHARPCVHGDCSVRVAAVRDRASRQRHARLGVNRRTLQRKLKRGFNRRRRKRRGGRPRRLITKP